MHFWLLSYEFPATLFPFAKEALYVVTTLIAPLYMSAPKATSAVKSHICLKISLQLVIAKQNDLLLIIIAIIARLARPIFLIRTWILL
jgi:hypothetical protein